MVQSLGLQRPVFKFISIVITIISQILYIAGYFRVTQEQKITAFKNKYRTRCPILPESHHVYWQNFTFIPYY